MKDLADLDNFGGTDADNDDLLLRAFEDHKVYTDLLALRRHLVLGKKGSGKTAIFKRLITTRADDFFTYGHTFSDYPWAFHEKQARVGIPDADKYTHSWKYLMLLSGAKLALNQDQSLPLDGEGLDAMSRLESFVVDTYGSRDPDLSQVYAPQKRLRIKPHLSIDLKFLKADITPESLPVGELPTIIPEVNAAVQSALLASLSPEHKYIIAFDQLDLSFDNTSAEYKNRLIGLILASRDINNAAREAGVKFFVVIFLRDDIYDILQFEDKNKITESYASRIEWDSARGGSTLKSLMEKRFTILLGEGADEAITWEHVFDEDKEMPGRQKKYNHITDRTYLRPRDIIKFCNSSLDKFKHRASSHQGDGAPTKIENIDIHDARQEYSEYLSNELDDEIHKHLPAYRRYFDALTSLGQWQFEKAELETHLKGQLGDEQAEVSRIIEELFNFSIIGFYRAGGRGFGGSEYVFRYRDPRARFDPTSTRLRVHPGLIEVLGLRRSGGADQ